MEEILTEELKKKNKKIKLLRQKLKASKLNNDKLISYLSKKFNQHQMEFLKMQINNSGKRNHGQRYTPEQKSLSLAIYKQSPKTYRFLQKLFTLPSKKTLARHSAYLRFESGINPKLFEFIKDKVQDLLEKDTYCTVAWDEVALMAHLDYCPTMDVIDGFEELLNVRRPNFATHALTFMIRGINTPFKQPIAYFFTDGLKGYELCELIQLVINAVLDTGIKCFYTPVNIAFCIS